MAKDFGFVPSKKDGESFISYNSEESDRIAKIVSDLSSLDFPVRYDRGLEHGEEYYCGRNGVQEDKAEAVRHLKMAAEQGDAKAQYDLGVCYERGEGVNQDKAEAVKYYKMAAEQGNAKAQFCLGILYELGEGVEQDYAEAARYYRMSAERGLANAQYNLGCFYYWGNGVEKDYAEAVRYFKMAAEQGYADAKAALERMGVQ